MTGGADEREGGARRIGRGARVALAMTLTLALVLFLTGLADEPLHGNEFMTVVNAREPVARQLAWLFTDVIDPGYGRNRPAHHLIVHATMAAMGNLELAVRLPSALAGIAAVALTFLLGRRVFGTREGLLAALFLTTAHAFLWASREARSFSMLVLVVVAATYAAVRASGSSRADRDRGRRWWAASGALCAFGYYVHPIMTFPAAAILLAVLGGQVLRRERRDLRGLAACFASGLVVMIPAVWQLVVLALREKVVTLDPTDRPQLEVGSRVGGELLDFLLPAATPALALVLALAAVGLASAFRRAPLAAWIATLTFGLPLAVLLTVTFGYGFSPSYLIFFLPFLCLLEARGLAAVLETALRRRSARPALLAAALVVAGVGVAALELPDLRREVHATLDWPVVTRAIEESTHGETVMVLRDFVGYEALASYLHEPGRFTWLAASGSTEQQLSDGVDALLASDGRQSVAAFVGWRVAPPAGEADDPEWAGHFPPWEWGRLAGHPVTARSFEGLHGQLRGSLLLPAHPELPAAERVAQLLVALADCCPNAGEDWQLLARSTLVLGRLMEAELEPDLGPYLRTAQAMARRPLPPHDPSHRARLLELLGGWEALVAGYPAHVRDAIPRLVQRIEAYETEVGSPSSR